MARKSKKKITNDMIRLMSEQEGMCYAVLTMYDPAEYEDERVAELVNEAYTALEGVRQILGVPDDRW
mgnify:CR=1